MSKFRLVPRSIRWRLQLWLAFLLACVLTGFGLTADRLMRMSRLGQMDSELETRVAALSRDLRESPFVRRAPQHPPPDMPPREPRGGPRPEPPREGRPPEPLPQDGPPEMTFALSSDTSALFNAGHGVYYYAVWSRDGSLLSASPGLPNDEVPPGFREMDSLVHWRTRGQFRESFHCTAFADCVLAGRSMQPELAAMASLEWLMLAAGSVLLVIGIGVGGWLTSRAIQPVNQISAAAVRISRGNLAERIDVADSDTELGRLASVLNSTFARLEAAFTRERQFTADAAHELRTPLAVIILEAQSALARERTPGEYREAVEVCLEAAQHMRQLTESLLELAHLDSGQAVIERTHIELGDLVRSCLDRIQTLAERQGVRVVTDLNAAPLAGNAGRLSQVVTNLLTNAVNYNRPGGEVRIATLTRDGEVFLTVSDNGTGIGPEDLPHIFDRFYCADKARSRREGHSGLGLAIVKAIIEAEGGAISVDSTPERGTTFEVRFPATADPRTGA